MEENKTIFEQWADRATSEKDINIFDLIATNRHRLSRGEAMAMIRELIYFFWEYGKSKEQQKKFIEYVKEYAPELTNQD